MKSPAERRQTVLGERAYAEGDGEAFVDNLPKQGWRHDMLDGGLYDRIKGIFQSIGTQFSLKIP